MKRIYKVPKNDGDGDIVICVVVKMVGPEKKDKKEIVLRCPKSVVSMCDMDHGLGRAHLDNVAITLCEPGIIDVAIGMLKSIKRECQ